MSPRPTLPSYNDDEVLKFHPVFEYAANAMLVKMGLCEEFNVFHHRSIDSIVVDFAFERISTGKIVLLCEIKRTQANAQSIRSRLQAQSYYTEAKHEMETAYYMVSNLELIDLFRFDLGRSKVSQQLIDISPLISGDLKVASEDNFYDKLINNLERLFSVVLDNNGTYYGGIVRMQDRLEKRAGSHDLWHQSFMPTVFEYIRGASRNFPELYNRIRDQWKAAETYKAAPDRLARKGLDIDFEKVFSDPIPSADDDEAFDTETLNEIYQAGKKRINGDDISSIVNEVLSPLSSGAVETDGELARLLSVVARDALQSDLEVDELICDPAAGSGRLLTSASFSFTDLTPRQVWANEIDPRFSEILSLRLGLHYASIIEPSNSPKITIEDIVDIDQSLFENVRVILMNPPFISGIDSVEKRNSFANRIKEITASDSITNKGQIGFETVFIELIWHYVQPGTVFAVIIPIRCRKGLSPEVRNFRRFLSEEFGLTHLVTYPQDGLFEDVMKQTTIIVGIKGSTTEDVKVITSQIPIENVNLEEMMSNLDSGQDEPTRGVKVINIQKSEIKEMVKNGWGTFCGTGSRAIEWCERIFGKYKAIDCYAVEYVRGRAGNRGCSDLAMITPKSSFNDESFQRLLPGPWKRPAIKYADDLPKMLNLTTAPNIAPVPTKEAFIEGSIEREKLLEIAETYLRILSLIKKKAGKQKKAEKDIDGVISAIKVNCTLIKPLSVLIPRAVRVEARIGIVEEDAVVSTNLFAARFNDDITSKLFASWLSSAFAQVQMEVYAINQEGMRKLEKEQIGKVLCPDMEIIEPDLQEKLIEAFLSDPPLNLPRLVIRRTDELWALHIASNEEESKVLLDEVFDLLAELIEERSP